MSAIGGKRTLPMTGQAVWTSLPGGWHSAGGAGRNTLLQYKHPFRVIDASLCRIPAL